MNIELGHCHKIYFKLQAELPMQQSNAYAGSWKLSHWTVCDLTVHVLARYRFVTNALYNLRKLHIFVRLLILSQWSISSGSMVCTLLLHILTKIFLDHMRDTLGTPSRHPWDTFGTEYSCLLMEGCVSDVFRWKVCLFITVYQQYIHCNPVEYCT